MPQSQRAELLEDLAAQVGQKLLAAGIDAPIAADAAQDLADWLAKHWGGQSVYFPMDIQYAVGKKHLEIFKKFNGNNASQLAKEYSLSTIRIYQIIKKCRTEMRKINQHTLFPDTHDTNQCSK